MSVGCGHSICFLRSGRGSGYESVYSSIPPVLWGFNEILREWTHVARHLECRVNQNVRLIIIVSAQTQSILLFFSVTSKRHKSLASTTKKKLNLKNTHNRPPWKDRVSLDLNPTSERNSSDGCSQFTLIYLLYLVI